MHSTLKWLRVSALAVALGSTGAAAWSLDSLIVDTMFVLKTADPPRSYEPTGSLFMNAVYETLVTYENGDLSQIVPGLSELPTVSEDGTVFTFKLREGTTFSDGSPVTAEDVVFSMRRLLAVKGPASRFIAGTTVDFGANPGEVVMTTAAPDPAFVAKLTYPAFAITNADVVRANGGTDAEDAATTDTADVFLATASAGSGPYVLASFDLVSEIVLERNENYYGEPAPFERIVIRNVANNAQRMNVSRGVSHIALDIRPDQIDTLGDDVNVLSTPGSDIAFVFLNRNPEVSEVAVNPDFTEAVRYGIDYAGMLDFIGPGVGRPGGIVPSIITGSVPSSEAVVRDVERAKAAMARSGFENPSIELAYASDFEKHGISFGDLGAKIQADLAEIGISVELVPQPVATNLDVYRAGTLQMSIQWWGPAYPDPNYYAFFNPGELVGLRAGWPAGSEPELEAMAAEVAAVIDPAARPALYQEWQRKLMEVGPFIQLFQPPFTMVSSKLVENVEYMPAWTVDLGAVRPAAQ
jgi:peptide/nickel transport system substrate-binding protein